MDVVGMPVSVMAHHQLVAGSSPGRTLAPRMRVPLSEAPRRVRVTGPRYRGERWLSSADCAAGDALELEVEPLPATVAFPCPPPGLTVACARCPGPAGSRVFLAEELPAIDVRSFTLEVELLLRAPGYRRQVESVTLHPGPNSIHVDLELL